MDLTVARAVLTSALLRSDAPAPEIRRDDAALFTKTLLKALNICTTAEVKACKDFIVRYITPSFARTAALSRYLLALSKAVKVDGRPEGDQREGLEGNVNGKVEPPQPSYRRLHILYIVHDVLCFLTVRSKDSAHTGHITFSEDALANLTASAGLLAQLAGCSDAKAGMQSTLAPVNDILDFWHNLNICSSERCEELRVAVKTLNGLAWDAAVQRIATQESEAALVEQRRREEELKWIVPRQHHLPYDITAPWHELPAANGLYQKRTDGYPLRADLLPTGGYRLKNGGRQADERLKRDVEELHRDALRCFDKYTNAEDVKDIDALGNVVWKDRPMRNFWGFTYDGIARRKGETVE